MINPIIQEIYIAYFERDTWKRCGIDDSCSLASSLQTRSNGILITGVRFNPISKHAQLISKLAFQFVKKYSTSPNI